MRFQALQQRLDEILADQGLTGAWVGVKVVSVDTGAVLYQRNPDGHFVPASNMKLFTAAAALDVLGPDFRFVTRLVSDRRPSGGVLDGDLYLVGGGDPTVLPQTVVEMASAFARTTGVRRITGRLVADDTWFDDMRLGEDWLWDDEPSWTTPPDRRVDAGARRGLRRGHRHGGGAPPRRAARLTYGSCRRTPT